MARLPLTLAAFGLAAAAGMCPLVMRPWPVAALAVAVLGLGYAALVNLRDGEAREDILDDILQGRDP